MRIVTIVPVGLEYDRALVDLRGEKFYLIHGRPRGKEDWVNRHAKMFCERVADYLTQSMKEVRGPYEIDVLDMAQCVTLLKELVKEETRIDPSSRIRINVGTCSKIMALAASSVASLYNRNVELYYPKTRRYIVLEMLARIDETGGPPHSRSEVFKRMLSEFRQHGLTRGAGFGSYQVVSVPAVPYQEPTRVQRDILNAFRQQERFRSVKDLVEFLMKRRGKIDSRRGFRSSVSYALGPLVDLGIVRASREGTETRLELTDAGRLYCLLFLD